MFLQTSHGSALIFKQHTISGATPALRRKSRLGCRLLLLLGLFLIAVLHIAHACSQTPLDLVTRMAGAEVANARLRQHFTYIRTERSTRTKDHLWVEAVAETTTGRMHRLLSIDGHALPDREKKTEDDRIQYLVAHPDAFRRENQPRNDDEAKTAELLKKMSQTFLFEFAGSEGSCTRVNFRPNPAYQEQSYQDRIIHAMAGYMLVSKAPGYRLCKLDGTLQRQVEFGYGLLGKVSQGSSFRMDRFEVAPDQWKTSKLLIKVDGNILLLKSVSRQEDSTHSDFKEIPFDTSIQEAAKLVNSVKF